MECLQTETCVVLFMEVETSKDFYLCVEQNYAFDEMFENKDVCLYEYVTCL